MHAVGLVALMLVTSPVAVMQQPIAGLARSADTASRGVTRKALRQRFADLMCQTVRNRRPLADPARVVPALVRLDGDLRNSRLLSFADRKRKHRAIQNRLADILPRLQVRQRELGRLRQGKRPTARTSGLYGPADERTANELIALIQDTIAPESWDVRGGQGSIRYYPHFHVLVVRNTAEVHRHIGGTLKQLRK